MLVLKKRQEKDLKFSMMVTPSSSFICSSSKYFVLSASECDSFLCANNYHLLLPSIPHPRHLSCTGGNGQKLGVDVTLMLYGNNMLYLSQIGNVKKLYISTRRSCNKLSRPKVDTTDS